MKPRNDAARLQKAVMMIAWGPPYLLIWYSPAQYGTPTSLVRDHLYQHSKILSSKTVWKTPQSTREALHIAKAISEYSTFNAHASSLSLYHARKHHNKTEKSCIEDLAPCADPGTRARTLEKRVNNRAANNSFAAAKLDAGADVPELAEPDGFGGGDDGLEGFKKRKAEQERVRTERELRREAVQRARREEREEMGKDYGRKRKRL